MSPTEWTTLKLSIVIPVYNEQETVDQVIDKVRGVDLGSIEKEIMVSDDGPTDGRAEILAAYGAATRTLRPSTPIPATWAKGRQCAWAWHMCWSVIRSTKYRLATPAALRTRGKRSV